MFVLSSCPASCRSAENYIPLSNAAVVKSPHLSARTHHITLPPVCLPRARIITVSNEGDATAVVAGWFIAPVDGYLLWLEHEGSKIKRSCEWFPLLPHYWIVFSLFDLFSLLTDWCGLFKKKDVCVWIDARVWVRLGQSCNSMEGCLNRCMRLTSHFMHCKKGFAWMNGCLVWC